MTSPTQHSLAQLRSEGYTCAITEHWNQFSKRRIDLFGFADILAIRPGEVVAVQTTTAAHVSARINKILELDTPLKWLQAGGRILIHGWALRGPRGKRKVWKCIERYVTLDDVMSK